MAGIRGITIELGLTDKTVAKLEAISKHTKALADELKQIDSETDELPTRFEGSE